MAILNSTEMAQAQTIINNTLAGIYELKDIYGSIWPTVGSPTTFGFNFKETVDAGHLQKIRHHSLKSNNHHDYEIL